MQTQTINLASLRDERMKANHKKATDEYREILLETINKAPESLGYEFGKWTAQRLATSKREEHRSKIKLLTNSPDSRAKNVRLPREKDSI